MAFDSATILNGWQNLKTTDWCRPNVSHVEHPIINILCVQQTHLQCAIYIGYCWNYFFTSTHTRYAQCSCSHVNVEWCMCMSMVHRSYNVQIQQSNSIMIFLFKNVFLPCAPRTVMKIWTFSVGKRRTFSIFLLESLGLRAWVRRFVDFFLVFHFLCQVSHFCCFTQESMRKTSNSCYVLDDISNFFSILSHLVIVVI